MGRRRRNFDPKGFENNRERQRRRQLAPLRSEDLPAPEDGPTPTALQPSRSSRTIMEASSSNSTQHATSAPPGVQSSNVNRGVIHIIVRRRDDEILIKARAKVVPGSKKVGITEEFANLHGLFKVRRPENKKRSIPEGPEPTDRLHTEYSAEIKIGHPGGGDPVYRTANVWKPVPDRVLDYDVMLPSDHRIFCESRDEEDQSLVQPFGINGPQVATIRTREDFYLLFEGREHDDIPPKGGDCRLCLDMAVVEACVFPHHSS